MTHVCASFSHPILAPASQVNRLKVKILTDLTTSYELRPISCFSWTELSSISIMGLKQNLKYEAYNITRYPVRTSGFDLLKPANLTQPKNLTQVPGGMVFDGVCLPLEVFF